MFIPTSVSPLAYISPLSFAFAPSGPTHYLPPVRAHRTPRGHCVSTHHPRAHRAVPTVISPKQSLRVISLSYLPESRPTASRAGHLPAHHHRSSAVRGLLTRHDDPVHAYIRRSRIGVDQASGSLRREAPVLLATNNKRTHRSTEYYLMSRIAAETHRGCQPRLACGPHRRGA